MASYAYTSEQLAFDVSEVNLKLEESGSNDRVLLVSEFIAVLEKLPPDSACTAGQLIEMIKGVRDGE